jgi:hypothetical protein
MIGVEAQLLGVEGLSPVDIGDREDDELELPIHVRSFLTISERIAPFLKAIRRNTNLR